MNLSDFIQNINLEIQTIGFGRNFEGHNLHFDITFIGRISDQISPRYRIKTNPLVIALSSDGIQFLPPEVFDSSRNQNNQWQTHIEARSSKSAITTPGSAIIINRRNSLSVRFTDYEDIQNPPEEEMEPSRMSMMNLWHHSYFESYIPYEEDKQTELFLQKRYLSQKLLKEVDLWEKEKKCQKQSFVNNEIDSDDTDEENEYVFKQRLFSTIDKKNSDTENIEDLLEKINLHEFYENEINLKK